MGDELPEELRWRGHVSDDDDDDDVVLGGNDFGIHSIQSRDYKPYDDDDDDDDPLGGASVLGGDGLLGKADRPGSSSSSVEDEDFVKILQESIERDLPK